MSEVIKRYDCGRGKVQHCYGCYQMEETELGDYVLASDYDRDTKALEDKARNQHTRDSAELRDLCSQRDGLKTELWRVKEERDKLAAELAELKAKCGSVFPEYKPLPELMMASYHEVKGWNACLDEVARLNASSVSAGEPVPATIGLTEYTYREALKTLREVLDPDDWMGEISMHAFIDAALSAPSRGERVREWISIHDKMPKIGERCLIRIPVGRHFEIEGGEYKGDGDWLGAWCSSKGRNQTYKVSHWMYAPSAAAPSKEGEV